MRTSESAIKKPSLAGGHWQRVGRAAFLCASARTHSYAHTHRLSSVHTVSRPTRGAPPLHPVATSRAVLGIRLARGGTGRPYVSDSFINNTADRVTASGVRLAHARAAAIQIRIVFAWRSRRRHLHNALLQVASMRAFKWAAHIHCFSGVTFSAALLHLCIGNIEFTIGTCVKDGASFTHVAKIRVSISLTLWDRTEWRGPRGRAAPLNGRVGWRAPTRSPRSSTYYEPTNACLVHAAAHWLPAVHNYLDDHSRDTDPIWIKRLFDARSPFNKIALILFYQIRGTS